MRFRVLALAGCQPLEQGLRRLVYEDSLESASSCEYLRAYGAGEDLMRCHGHPRFCLRLMGATELYHQSLSMNALEHLKGHNGARQG